ncbi:hypothetical protein LEP1GSC179_2281 [Leptospira santarosai str. MOR084]|uniref:TNase-like domain-containing protein n=1 Tax=Leptospira santarosai str. MOR084 TaxID=1049984 RepID=A0A0E2BIG4_9LEPT|nr:hypothetical protein LEP1GSC179_2281 [Leptospira santarosai str. MOR084]
MLKTQSFLRNRGLGDSSALNSEFSKTGDKELSGLKRPILGLFTYRLIQIFSSNLERSVPNLDLGFDIRIESLLGGKSKFPVGSILTVSKNRKGYSFQKVSGNKLLYTYKAFLEGDRRRYFTYYDRSGLSYFYPTESAFTGFGRSRVRFKEGASVKRFVESQLKDCPFLLIKTYGSDKYDRYLVDVIFLKNEKKVSNVMTNGLFLNQEILRKGFADPM